MNIDWRKNNLANWKPARIPPQTPPAGGKSAEAGRIRNPRQIASPCRVHFISFNHLDFAHTIFELRPKNTASWENGREGGMDAETVFHLTIPPYPLFVRRGRDSNPRRISPHWFSKPALSSAQPPLRIDNLLCVPKRTRNYNLKLRKLALYPVEL